MMTPAITKRRPELRALMVIKHEAANYVDISRFDADTIMPETDSSAHAVEQ